MGRTIDSVAVLGGGTMGSGIAGACAQAGCKVLLLDVSQEAVENSLDRIVNGRPPAVDDAEAAGRIELGTFDDLARIEGYDWICEAVIEDLETKGVVRCALGLPSSTPDAALAQMDKYAPLVEHFHS